MAKNYTYEPLECMDGNMNQMRFELGDTVTDEDGLPAMLSDEEYYAILKAFEGKWKRAKLKCLEAIMMKLSYEVDTSVDGLSYSLNQRAERWRAMYDKLAKELKISVPTSMTGISGGKNGQPYFFSNMHSNHRK